MPTVCSICTAARLLDVFNAARIVMAPARLCSSSGTHAPCSVSIGTLRFEITVAGE